MSKIYCLNCGEQLGVLDEDPNGDKNVICVRCHAEEEHDFDKEPDVEFARNGSRRETGNTLDPNELFVVSALSRKGVAKDLNEYLDATESKIKRLKPGDARLTKEIMEFAAKENSEIDSYWSANAQDDAWQGALWKTLRKMGYSEKEIDPV